MKTGPFVAVDAIIDLNGGVVIIERSNPPQADPQRLHRIQKIFSVSRLVILPFHLYRAVFTDLPEITREIPCVAGGPLLRNLKKYRIAFAVHIDALHFLSASGCLALHHDPSL